MKLHVLSPQEQQLLLGSEFAPPPPECPARPGEHFWVTIKSYSKKLYWPPSAYQPHCSFCGVPKAK